MTKLRNDREYTAEELEIWRAARRKRIIHRMEMRRLYSFLVGAGIVLLAFVGVFILQQESVQRRFIYPMDYQQTILHYSARYHVEKDLVAAVIQSESKFRHSVESDKGAVGLMQLMPSTAKWISDELEENNFSEQKLREPEVNIRYGTWYLSSLKNEFYGNEILMLAAYNAGRGNVHEWMDEYGWDYNFNDIDAIPYKETAAYVRDVLKNKAKYKKLYK